MNRWVLILLMILLPAAALPAQVVNPPRELAQAFRMPPKLLVGLDTRRSFVSGRDVKVMGIRVGLEFDKRARVGFGVYTLASAFQHNFVVNNALNQPDTVEAQLRFSYMSVFFEYVLLTTKHWEVSFPLQLGVGDQSYSRIPYSPNAFLLGEAGVWASYKIFPFLGLAGGVGYRHLLVGASDIRENFNAPTYNFGVKFWAGYLIEKFLKKKKGT